jgi:hypothetical protein
LHSDANTILIIKKIPTKNKAAEVGGYCFWKLPGITLQNKKNIHQTLFHADTGVEFLRLNPLANGLNTATAATIFTAQRRAYRRMKTPSYFTNLLREQGYSDNAIEEICRWYVCSTSKDSTGELPRNSKN